MEGSVNGYIILMGKGIEECLMDNSEILTVLLNGNIWTQTRRYGMFYCLLLVLQNLDYTGFKMKMGLQTLTPNNDRVLQRSELHTLYNTDTFVNKKTYNLK